MADSDPEAPWSQTARLTVDLDAIARNWRALAARAPGAETGAVVKADAYGLGMARVAPALARAGARSFFVANAREGAALRRILGPGPDIWIFNGFTPAERELFAKARLFPVLCSLRQLREFRAALPDLPEGLEVGLHIETGINRQGFGMHELDALRAEGLGEARATLLLSHLACADEPEHGMNLRQRGAFAGRSALLAAAAPGARMSLAATGGILLGEKFHFDLTRPGIGLYGGLPFAQADPVVRLEAPILQVRRILRGESVGYGASWTAPRDSMIGVLPAGYADGLPRALRGTKVWLDGRPAPLVGRVSMDMLTVDLTDHPRAAPGRMVEILGPNQSVDQLAAAAGTIGYEILTSLGARYERRYTEADPHEAAG